MEILLQGISGLLAMIFIFLGGFCLGAVFELHVLNRSEKI